MAVSPKGTLRKSVWSLISIYYLVESASFFAVARTYIFSLIFFIIFLSVQTAFCIAVALFLIINTGLFFNTNTGEVLSYVNLPCKITLFRITMIPSVIFLIIALKTWPVGPVLAPFIGLACLSDIFDGYISRRRNEVTFMGKILDSSSDYLLLGIAAIAYYFYDLLPSWLFWLILCRLLLHSTGMMILFLFRKRLIPQTTILGKIAIAASMVLFVFKPAALLSPLLMHATNFVEISAGILIALSIVDKGIFFIKGITLNLAERQGNAIKKDSHAHTGV